MYIVIHVLVIGILKKRPKWLNTNDYNRGKIA